MTLTLLSALSIVAMAMEDSQASMAICGALATSKKPTVQAMCAWHSLEATENEKTTETVLEGSATRG